MTGVAFGSNFEISGLLDIGRELFPDLVDPFADILRGDVDRLPELEFERDLADVFHAGRIHGLESVDGADRVLEALGDIDLDLGRLAPG